MQIENGVLKSIVAKDIKKGAVIIPKEVTHINEKVFLNKHIKSLELSEGLISIGDLAFNSNSLQEVKIPSSVKIIGIGAFRGNFIKMIEIPGNVNKICDRAFEYNELEKVIIHEGVKIIGDYAFLAVV